MTVNPRITIQTYLGRIPPENIKTVRQQLSELQKTLRSSAFDVSTKKIDVWNTSMAQANDQIRAGNRDMGMMVLRTKAMKQGFNTASEAAMAMGIAFRDMFTAVGFLNTALSIMLSRFGTMVIIFAAVQGISRFKRAMMDAARDLDTAYKRVSSIIVDTSGDMGQAMESLSLDAIDFATKYGVAINQISDTQFYLASAGRNTVQVQREFAEAQKLVIATAKDLTATLQDNKEVVEVYAGLMNIYRKSNESAAESQERATHTASVLFEAFKTQQILIGELAAGLQYASAQAKAMGVSIDELVAILAVLNTGMIKGSKAGTSLANAMRDTVRRADKLKEVFDIDVSGVGKNFSLVETVIKRVRQEIDSTGVSIELFTKLFEVYNIRATRAIIGAAVQYDKIVKLLKDFEHAEEDLDAAIQIVTSSMKAQEQRSANIKQVLLGVVETILTGGRGLSRVLEEINDKMLIFVKIVGFVAGALTVVGAVIGRFIDGVTDFFASIADLIGIDKLLNMEELVHKYSRGSWAAQNFAMAMNKARALFRFARTDSVKLVENLHELNYALRNDTTEVDHLGEAIDQMIKSLKNYNKALESNIIMFRELEGVKVGAELAYDPTEKYIFQVSRFIKSLTSKISESADGVIPVGTLFNFQMQSKDATAAKKYTAELLYTIDLFKASIGGKDEFIKLFDSVSIHAVGLEEKIKRLKLRAMNETAALFYEMRKTYDSFEDMPVDLQQDTANKIENIHREAKERISKLEFEQYDESVKADLEYWNKRLEALKMYFKNRDVLINNKPFKEFLEENKVSEIKEVTFRKELSTGAFNEIAEQSKKILESSGKEIDTIIKNNLKMHAGNYLLFQGKMIDLENTTTQEIIRIWAERYGSLELITDEQMDALVEKARESEGIISEIIKRDYADQYELLEEFKSGTTDLYDALQRNIGKIQLRIFEQKEMVGDVELLKELQKILDELGTTGTLDIVALQRSLDQLVDARTKQEMDKLIEAIKQLTSRKKENAEQVARMEEKAFRDQQERISQTAEMYGNFNEILSKTAEIVETMGDEMSSNTLKTFGAINNAISSVIYAYTSLQQVIHVTGNTMVHSLARINFALGTVGAVLSMISTIVSLFKDVEEDKQGLEQEFLSPQGLSRLSPDYGQARIINNRNELRADFNLLEPSQLTPDNARRFALFFYKEFKELIKTSGDL